MTTDSSSTIAALASAPAPAGVAVVRVSGPSTKAILGALFEGAVDPIAVPRTLCYGTIVDPGNQRELDQGMAVYFAAPNSFTGEDIAEFQIHGSPLIARAVLEAAYRSGAEPAEPGEFTKRAFLNGKLDLTQAEAIADLVQATSERALTLAQEQLGGRLRDALLTIGEPLRDALAQIEATIDFPEEDIEPETLEAILGTLRKAEDAIGDLVASYSYGHLVKDGFRVLLCGRPNVGKSSLLNRLLGTERAIVTELSGTTRDLIEEETLLEGLRFVFCDSAGLTETEEKVEQIGIELAKQKVPWADLILCILDAGDDAAKWQSVLEELPSVEKPIWFVINKADLVQDPQLLIADHLPASSKQIVLSAKSGLGIERLQQELVSVVEAQHADQSEASVVVTNTRHQHLLIQAGESLERCIEAGAAKLPLELVSAELRIVLRALEEIVGVTATEDILGRIFSRFCIGK